MLKAVQLISLLVLAPIFFSPFFFCPFHLPYLYCFICPRRCLWYHIRGWVLLVALGMNLKNDFFCQQVCPWGRSQVLLSKIRTRKITLPKFWQSLKYISLICVALIVVLSKSSAPILIIKIRNLLLGIFLFALAMSIINYRFFCSYLCPIRALNRVCCRK